MNTQKTELSIIVMHEYIKNTGLLIIFIHEYTKNTVL
jgi:hypothetical protein